MRLTICYITSRKNPRFRWFSDSLMRELGADAGQTKLVVIDRHALADGRQDEIQRPDGIGAWVHCEPKPTVWQGRYRLTNKDYFAASNTRNTGICHAPGSHVAFVDDLSVLLPGWYSSVKEAMNGGYIMLGSYRKVLKMEVDGGVLKNHMPFTPGVDSRIHRAPLGDIVDCPGCWLFGCSFCGPVEAFLSINGFDEDCDCVGGEDYIAGMMLERRGWKFKYDRRAITFESEEAHHEEPPLCRLDKGQSPNDKSHAILNMARNGRNTAPNYFGPGGISALREKIIAGEPFPPIGVPDRDWFDGQPLSEM